MVDTLAALVSNTESTPMVRRKDWREGRATFFFGGSVTANAGNLVVLELAAL